MHAALVAIVDEQFGEKEVVPLLFLVILNLKLLCSDAISWSWVLHNTNFRSDQLNRKFATDRSR